MFGSLIKMFISMDVLIPPLVISVLVFIVMYWHYNKKRSELLVSPGIRASTWIMVGGDQSKIYYDIDKACTDLESMEYVDKWYIDNILEIHRAVGIDSLAFIEREDGPVGAVTKKDMLSSSLKIPSFIVRPKKRIKASVLKGTISVMGKKVVIVSDVATTGHSIERVVDILQSHGARTVGVVTIVNRGGPKTKELFKQRSIDFRYAEDNLDRYLPQEEDRVQ